MAGVTYSPDGEDETATSATVTFPALTTTEAITFTAPDLSTTVALIAPTTAITLDLSDGNFP